MIKREVFKKTEGMLYRYFKDKRDMNMIQHKILVLENKKNKLSEEARILIDLKYGEGGSFYKIADRLNMSKSTAERRRGEIIEDIAKFYNFYGMKMG